MGGTPLVNPRVSPENTYGRPTISSRNRSLSPARRNHRVENQAHAYDPPLSTVAVPWISPGVGETHWHAPENTSISEEANERDEAHTYDMEYSSISSKKAPVYVFETE